MLYILNSTIFSPYAVVDMEKFQKIYYDFFIKQENDGKFLNYTTIKFKTQESYTKNNIENEDFLLCSTPIPIFSERFVNSVSKILVNDILFYPCDVMCEGSIFTFFMGKILKSAPIVNKELSEYRQLRDGSKSISRIRYNECLKDEELYIVRDMDAIYAYTVTEKFKQLIEEKKMNIKLKEAK